MNPYEERCARCRERKVDHLTVEAFDPTVSRTHRVYLCATTMFLSPRDAT